jgi:hypothetical protein
MTFKLGLGLGFIFTLDSKLGNSIAFSLPRGRHNNQHNDTQQNSIQHNGLNCDIQHNGLWQSATSNFMLIVVAATKIVWTVLKTGFWSQSGSLWTLPDCPCPIWLQNFTISFKSVNGIDIVAALFFID